MLKSNEDNPTNINYIMSINTKLKFIISSRDKFTCQFTQRNRETLLR